MVMKRKPTDDELDALARSLLGSSVTEEQGRGSSDAVFLAGFRQKLAEARALREEGAPSIGGWCWKAAPWMAMVSAVLAFALYVMANGYESSTDSADEVLWAWAEEDSSELSGDLVLDAILEAETRR
jgi:hypothetical protein